LIEVESSSAFDEVFKHGLVLLRDSTLAIIVESVSALRAGIVAARRTGQLWKQAKKATTKKNYRCNSVLLCEASAK